MSGQRRSSLTARDVAAGWLVCVLIGLASLAAMSALRPEMPPAATMATTISICASPPVSACSFLPEISANPGALAVLRLNPPRRQPTSPGRG